MTFRTVHYGPSYILAIFYIQHICADVGKTFSIRPVTTMMDAFHETNCVHSILTLSRSALRYAWFFPMFRMKAP